MTKKKYIQSEFYAGRYYVRLSARTRRVLWIVAGIIIILVMLKVFLLS